MKLSRTEGVCTINASIILLLVMQSLCICTSACPGIAQLCPEVLLLGPLCCLPCPQHIPKLREAKAAQAARLRRCKESVLYFGSLVDLFPAQAHGNSETKKRETAVLSLSRSQSPRLPFKYLFPTPCKDLTSYMVLHSGGADKAPTCEACSFGRGGLAGLLQSAGPRAHMGL